MHVHQGKRFFEQVAHRVCRLCRFGAQQPFESRRKPTRFAVQFVRRFIQPVPAWMRDLDSIQPVQHLHYLLGALDHQIIGEQPILARDEHCDAVPSAELDILLRHFVRQCVGLMRGARQCAIKFSPCSGIQCCTA
jgi:hypothetical protein